MLSRSSRGPEFSSQHLGAAHNCLRLQLSASGLSGHLYPHTHEHTHNEIFTTSGYRKGVGYTVGEGPSQTPETSYERPLAPRFKGTINQTRVGRSPERSSGDKTTPGPTGPENRCISSKPLNSTDNQRSQDLQGAGWERWLIGKKHLLLLPKTRVWFPAPTQQVTAISNSSSGVTYSIYIQTKHTHKIINI